MPSDDEVLVAVVLANSPAEAAELTELLRGVRIPAMPRMPHGRPLREAESIPVLVPEPYYDVACQLLDLSTHRPEGDATREEIERDLAAEEPEHGPDILRGAGRLDPRRVILAALALMATAWMALTVWSVIR